jgi:hypothetical protein
MAASAVTYPDSDAIFNQRLRCAAARFFTQSHTEQNMKKLTLELDSLQVQSFETAAGETARFGTVNGHAGPKKTGIDDTNCSAIDACASARGCTQLETCLTFDPAACESADDACPSGRGCTSLFPC